MNEAQRTRIIRDCMSCSVPTLARRLLYSVIVQSSLEGLISTLQETEAWSPTIARAVDKDGLPVDPLSQEAVAYNFEGMMDIIAYNVVSMLPAAYAADPSLGISLEEYIDMTTQAWKGIRRIVGKEIERVYDVPPVLASLSVGKDKIIDTMQVVLQSTTEVYRVGKQCAVRRGIKDLNEALKG